MPKPTEFPAASTPLAGDEIIPLIQDGVDSRATLDEVTAAVATDITAHITDVDDAHAASAVSFTPAGTIASTNVQEALEELDDSFIDTTELGDGVNRVSTIATTPSPGVAGRTLLVTDRHGGTFYRDSGGANVQAAASVNAGPPPLSFTAGASQFYGIHVFSSSAISNTAGNLFLGRAFLQDRTYDRILVESTAAGAGTTWRLGYYPMAASGMPDWANVFDAGTVDMSAAASQRTVTINRPVTEGWYWLAVLVDAFSAAPTVRTSNLPDRMLPVLGTSGQAAGLRYSGVTIGSLPVALPATFAGGVSQMPCVWLRTST
jgi:hypothetical protein